MEGLEIQEVSGADTTSELNVLGNSTELQGETGTGGLLIIYADSLNNSGIINALGKKGGKKSDGTGSCGGSSGGGSINIFYNGNFSIKGNINANGGEKVFANKVGGSYGGNGTITSGTISSGSFVNQ